MKRNKQKQQKEFNDKQFNFKIKDINNRLVDIDNKILHKECSEVKDFDSIDDKIEIMKLFIKNNNIYGVSANQLNISEKIMIISEDLTKKNLLTFINPNIIVLMKEKFKSSEGSISIKQSFNCVVERQESCMLEWFTIDNERRVEVFNGFTALLIQHHQEMLMGKSKIFEEYNKKDNLMLVNTEENFNKTNKKDYEDKIKLIVRHKINCSS